MLTSIFMTCLFIVTSSAFQGPEPDRCLATPYPCNTTYTHFLFPNTFGMNNIEEAQAALTEELASIGFFGYSRELPRAALCNMFFPVCTVLESPIPSCENTCETLKDGFAVTDRIRNLDCDSFPDGGLCVGFPLDD